MTDVSSPPVEPPVPLLEFDGDERERITPADSVEGSIPERVVLCFFKEAIRQRCEGAEVVHELLWEGLVLPVYSIETQWGSVGVVHPGVGAALATAMLEELVALGGRSFVVCGSAGAIAGDLPVGRVVVPTGAVRDEGTSYHYAPASRVIAADANEREVLLAVLREHAIEAAEGLTWTTDAPFRETPSRIARRRNEGCLVVEMEAAALMAAAAFRGVALAYYLYAGDDASGSRWDERGWRTSGMRLELLDLAVEAVCRMSMPSPDERDANGDTR